MTLGLQVKSQTWPRIAVAEGACNAQRRSLMRYLHNYLSHCARRNIKGALVFDIDETLIDEQDRDIRDVIQLYKRFRHTFPTYIITARPDRYRRYTKDQLERHHIDCYKRLFLLPNDTHPGKFKWNTRKHIEAVEGRILATVGDQMWDVVPHPIDARFRSMSNNPHRGALIQRSRQCGEVGVLLPSTGS